MSPIDGNVVSSQSALGMGMGMGLSQPGGMPAQTGTFRGDTVMVKDAASVLADAAEEMSMHHSEKAEDKQFAEREVRSESPIEVMKAEEITAYLEAAKAFSDAESLAALAKRMQSSGENPRELARQQSRDPTQQYVLLQHALADAKANNAPIEVQERLADALADLEVESGPQIRAGLNTIGAASEYGHSAEEVAAFQSTYQDVVLGDNSLAQTLKLALERLGGPTGDDFARGLQGLVKALGTDLSAARPSTDSNRLQSLVQDLYQLEVTATVLDNCKELADTLRTKFGVTNLNPVELMKELVAVTGEKWVGATRFTGLADRLGLRDVGAQIAFHTAIKSMLRELPPKVFPDADVRQSILTAAQEALDIAIDKEEE